MTHMYGSTISAGIYALTEAQRIPDVDQFQSDRRWMYGVDLMPKLPKVYVFKGMSTDIDVREVMKNLEHAWHGKPQWEYM